jgi:hypothetical protein
MGNTAPWVKPGRGISSKNRSKNMNKTRNERLLVWAALTVFCAIGWVAFAGTPSTEAVISKNDGLHIGGKVTDRIGFYGGGPTAKPIITVVDAAHIVAALAAQGLLATATPTATATATATTP